MRDEKLIYISDTRRAEFSHDRGATPYWWADEEGLSGLENNIYTSKGAGQDGEHFVSHNLGPRIITIDGQIFRDIERNRANLLALLNPKHAGRLVYQNGEAIMHIPCYIRQAPIIGHGIFPDFQIEFLCPNPYWRGGDGENRNVADIAQWVKNWEWPLEIPKEGFELEYRSQSLIVNVPNTGSVESGITAVFRATGPTQNPSLINVYTQEELSLTIQMQTGDEITVKTGYGEKSAVLLRGGIETNVFNCVDVESAWLHMHPGDNLIRYDATIVENLEVSIYYDHYYLGV